MSCPIVLRREEHSFGRTMIAHERLIVFINVPEPFVIRSGEGYRVILHIQVTSNVCLAIHVDISHDVLTQMLFFKMWSFEIRREDIENRSQFSQ